MGLMGNLTLVQLLVDGSSAPWSLVNHPGGLAYGDLGLRHEPSVRDQHVQMRLRKIAV